MIRTIQMRVLITRTMSNESAKHNNNATEIAKHMNNENEVAKHMHNGK